MISFINHSEIANENHMWYYFTLEDNYIFLKYVITDIGEDVAKLESLYITNGNVK